MTRTGLGSSVLDMMAFMGLISQKYLSLTQLAKGIGAGKETRGKKLRLEG